MFDPDDERSGSDGLGARAELRAWYLGHLRPRLVDAVAAGIVGPGAVEELDLQVASFFDFTERPFGSHARGA